MSARARAVGDSQGGGLLRSVLLALMSSDLLHCSHLSTIASFFPLLALF